MNFKRFEILAVVLPLVGALLTLSATAAAQVPGHIPRVILFYSQNEAQSISEIENFQKEILKKAPHAVVEIKNFADFETKTFFRTSIDQEKVYEYLVERDADSVVGACKTCNETLIQLRNQHLLQNFNMGYTLPLGFQIPQDMLSMIVDPRPSLKNDKTQNFRPRTGPTGMTVPVSRALFLFDEQDALQAHVSLIRGARHTLDSAMYIHSPDDIGLLQMALFRDAARRGVTVRLVIDDHGSGRLSKGLLRHLRDEGVQIRLYHKVAVADFSASIRRLHDKYVGADHKYKIVGTRNRENGYFGVTPDKNPRNFEDVEIYYESNVPDDSDIYFNNLWNSKEVTVPEGLDGVSVQAIKEADASLGLHESQDFAGLIKEWDPQLWAGLKPVKSLKFIYDPLGLQDNSAGLANDIFTLMKDAVTDITIITPYLVLTREFEDALKDARSRGVGINIYTNSSRTSDSPWLAAGMNGHLKMLRAEGIGIFQYKGPKTIHSKAIAIDGGRKFYLGSYNVDPRSQRLNTEIGVIIEDENFGRKIISYAEQVGARSWNYSQPGDEAPRSAKTFCAKLLEFPVKIKAIRNVL